MKKSLNVTDRMDKKREKRNEFLVRREQKNCKLNEGNFKLITFAFKYISK